MTCRVHPSLRTLLERGYRHELGTGERNLPAFNGIRHRWEAFYRVAAVSPELKHEHHRFFVFSVTDQFPVKKIINQLIDVMSL